MCFIEFSKNRKDCFATEDGFLMWKITDNSDSEPGILESGGKNLIVHVLVCEGRLEVEFGGKCYNMARHSFGSFIDSVTFGIRAIGPGTRAYITALSESYFFALVHNNPPIPYGFVMYVRNSPVKDLTAKNYRTLSLRMEDIYETCCDTEHTFRRDMIGCNIKMLLFSISDSFIRSNESVETNELGLPDRKRDIFMAFLKLLPVHSAKEHSVSFYASTLCITAQYLNRIVRAYSNKTVHQWISYQLMGEISKRLAYFDDTAQELAERFHFSDQSALTKFVKRNTGYSLMEYKKTLNSV